MSGPSGLRPAKYVKLDRMQPATQGHNVTVKVLSKNVVVDRQQPNGQRLKLEECLVGDDTGTMYFTARNDQCDMLKVGDIVDLRNAKVVMHHNHMRLGIDRWGKLTQSSRQISSNIRTDRNFSDIEYELTTGD